MSALVSRLEVRVRVGVDVSRVSRVFSHRVRVGVRVNPTTVPGCFWTHAVIYHVPLPVASKVSRLEVRVRVRVDVSRVSRVF